MYYNPIPKFLNESIHFPVRSMPSKIDIFGSNGPKDPTNSLKLIITPHHAHFTPTSCIVHNSLQYFLPHTIHGLFLSPIFIENERVES